MCHVLLCGWVMIQFFRLLEASFMATFLIVMTNRHQKQLENKSSFSCMGWRYCPSQRWEHEVALTIHCWGVQRGETMTAGTHTTFSSKSLY